MALRRSTGILKYVANNVQKFLTSSKTKATARLCLAVLIRAAPFVILIWIILLTLRNFGIFRLVKYRFQKEDLMVIKVEKPRDERLVVSYKWREKLNDEAAERTTCYVATTKPKFTVCFGEWNTDAEVIDNFKKRGDLEPETTRFMRTLFHQTQRTTLLVEIGANNAGFHSLYWSAMGGNSVLFEPNTTLSMANIINRAVILNTKLKHNFPKKITLLHHHSQSLVVPFEDFVINNTDSDTLIKMSKSPVCGEIVRSASFFRQAPIIGILMNWTAEVKTADMSCVGAVINVLRASGFEATGVKGNPTKPLKWQQWRQPNRGWQGDIVWRRERLPIVTNRLQITWT